MLGKEGKESSFVPLPWTEWLKVQKERISLELRKKKTLPVKLTKPKSLILKIYSLSIVPEIPGK